MKRFTTTSLAVSLLAGSATFTVAAGQPKIVVGIVVDQLRTDYLEQLRPYFGKSGFNRMLSEGVYLPDVDFKGTVADAPSGAAVIYTGAWPSANGVASAEVLDIAGRRNLPALADMTAKGPDYKPDNLKLSTLADEFFINNGTLSKIYSVSGDPQVSVVTAGHAGTSAIWLDDHSARWSAPSFYGPVPGFVTAKNRTTPVSQRINTANWKPLNPSSFYPTGSVWHGDGFSYGFNATSAQRVGQFKDSPLFNTEVTDMAIDILKGMKTDAATGNAGMLNVGYNLSPISYDYDDDNRPELFDAYMRLDSDLGRLLDTIYATYGKDNAVVFLSSSGYAAEPSIPELKTRIPSGEVTLKKVESLLNAYLSATHGNADYVALIKDGRLFLDTKALEQKGLRAADVRKEAKDFLLRMGGLHEVLTIDEVLHSDNRRLQDFALRVDAKNAPDLFLTFTPGWTVTDDNVYPTVSYTARMSAPLTPAFIMAPQLVPATIGSTVEATVLAPTVASAMRIRPPNGAASRPLVLTQKDNQK